MQEGGPHTVGGSAAAPVAALAAAAVAAATGQQAAGALYPPVGQALPAHPGSSALYSAGGQASGAVASHPSGGALYSSSQQIAAQQQQHHHMAAAAHAHGHNMALGSAPSAASAAAAAASSSKAPSIPPESLIKPHPAVRLFEHWMQSHPTHSSSYRPLHELSVDTLLSVIGDWISEAQKSNGGEYSPDTLYVYLSSLQRHVRRTHGTPHFNFLESLQVRSAMEKKFGADAVANIMMGGHSGAQRALKREAVSASASASSVAEEHHDGDDDADSSGEGAAAAGDKSEGGQGQGQLNHKPHYPPMLSRKRNRKGGKAGGAGSGAAATTFAGGAADGNAYTSAAKRTAAGAAVAAAAAAAAGGGAAGTPAWMAAMGLGPLHPTPAAGTPTDSFLTPAVVASFKPVKPSHSHRSFRTEQRLLSARQDPSTPEGLLRCLLWIMFTHVPNLTKNACWNLKVNQFVVRTMQGDGSDVRDAPEQATGDEGAAAAATATGEGKTIRFLQFTQSRKMMRANQGEGPPEIIMYEQPTMRHCCPVTLYQQYMAHRPHRAIEISNCIRRGMFLEKPPGEETDAGSFIWLLTRKHLETSGEDAGVWYANRRVGQATMDKLIAVVRLSRNQPPIADYDALAARAERIDTEDQEESGGGGGAEINITTGDEAWEDGSADHSKRAKMPPHAASSSAAAAASSSAAAAVPPFPSFPSVAAASPSELARLGLSMGPSGLVLPPTSSQLPAHPLYMPPPGMLPPGMNMGMVPGTSQGDLMMRHMSAYNHLQAMASQASQQLGAFPWAHAAAAAASAVGPGGPLPVLGAPVPGVVVGSQQVQMAEAALMKKITADRADAHNHAPRGVGNNAANAAAAAASSPATAASPSPATAASSSSSKLKSANGSPSAVLASASPSPPPAVAAVADSLPAVHEYLRTYGAHLRELKETVAALEASLTRVKALVGPGTSAPSATTTATLAAAVPATAAIVTNTAPASAAASVSASRGDEDGEDGGEDDMEQED